MSAVSRLQFVDTVCRFGGKSLENVHVAALLTDISGYATHAAFHDALLEQGVSGVADFLRRGVAGHGAFGKERLDVTACVIFPLD